MLFGIDTNWRRCLKCEGLWYTGGGSTGICPAGQGHYIANGNNYLLYLEELGEKGQRGWRWCEKCQGIWFTGDNTTGACAAGGGHHLRRSGEYTLGDGVDQDEPFGDPLPVEDPSLEVLWSWCRKCQVLFSREHSLGRCPTGGAHDPTGSGGYRVWCNVERPLWPEEKSACAALFPNLDVDRTITSARKTGYYNCFAWSVGVTNEFVIPGATIADFDTWYGSYGYVRSSSGPIAVLGFGDQDIRHAALSGLGHGPHWESKLGGWIRIQHGLNEIEGGGCYGNVVAFYAPPRGGEGSKPPVTPTMSLARRRRGRTRKVAFKVPGGIRAEFEKRFGGWQSAIANDPCSLTSSTTAPFRRLPEFDRLVAMGPEILPLLVEKLAVPGNFLAVQVFERLSPAVRKRAPRGKRVFMSEQQKAAAIVEKWLRGHGGRSKG